MTERTPEWFEHDRQLATNPPAHLRPENIDQNGDKRPFPLKFVLLNELTKPELELLLSQHFGLDISGKDDAELRGIARIYLGGAHGVSSDLLESLARTQTTPT